jgi:hypothetical protein
MDPAATETVKIYAKNSGFWWTGKKTNVIEDEASSQSSSGTAGKLSNSSSSSSSNFSRPLWLSRRAATIDSAEVSSLAESDTATLVDSERPRSRRSLSSFLMPHKTSNETWSLVDEPEPIDVEVDLPSPKKRPNPPKALSDSSIKVAEKNLPPPPTPDQSMFRVRS